MARRKERRRHQRIDVALPVKIEYNEAVVSAKTKNISLLGAYIEIDRKFSIGAPLNIAIKVPKIERGRLTGQKRIDCRGAAFRCQPRAGPESQYGIGIFFRSISREGEKTLSRYINYVLAQEKKEGKIYMRKRKLLKRKGGKR